MHQLNLFNGSKASAIGQQKAVVIVRTENSSAEQPKKQVTLETENKVAAQENSSETKKIVLKNTAGAPEKVYATSSNGRGRKSYKEMDAENHLVEVPDDEILFQKQYYSISEVAQWFNVNASLIRFWENEFDILKPRKNRKGDRLFRPEDIKNLQLIYHLLRQKKYSIEGARQYLKDNRKKAELNVQLIQSLTKFRTFLLELRATLEA